MRTLGIAVAVLALSAAPSIAQEKSETDANGYVSGFGGAAWASGNSTGSVLFEGGVRIAPHVMAFADIGRFNNLQSDLQPTLDATTAALSNQGIGVTATGTLPAWYGIGGVRAEVAANAHALPYVLGGLGAARLNPTAQLAYATGILPDGSTPSIGTDITSTLMTSGSYTAPTTSTALMLMLGGGVQVPLVPHWAVDVGYRFSRIAADSTLSASPLNTNVMSFGVGYRF